MDIGQHQDDPSLIWGARISLVREGHPLRKCCTPPHMTLSL
jgi:hypothetical protein